MRLLYIFGNGFDLNLGLKTSYKDFYQYYKNINSKDLLIQKFKDSIDPNCESWADLEYKFGEYTREIESEEEFDLIYDDLLSSLSYYLLNEEKKLNLASFDIKKFIKGISNPVSYLLQVDRLNINNIFQYNDSKYIDFINLNYTESLKRLLDLITEKSNIIDKNLVHSETRISKIIDIHGSCELGMVFGVSDTSQILNLLLSTNFNIVEALVKDYNNKAGKHNKEEVCYQLIESFDILCIYGCSLGKTDNYLWKKVLQRLLSSNSLLILFIRDEKLKEPIINNTQISRNERYWKDKFLNNFDLDDASKIYLDNKIFIRFNSNIFDIKDTN